MNKQLANKIVDKIIDDLNDRNKFYFNQLDNDIQEEIKTAWIDIVLSESAIELNETIEITDLELISKIKQYVDRQIELGNFCLGWDYDIFEYHKIEIYKDINESIYEAELTYYDDNIETTKRFYINETSFL